MGNIWIFVLFAGAAVRYASKITKAAYLRAMWQWSGVILIAGGALGYLIAPVSWILALQVCGAVLIAVILTLGLRKIMSPQRRGY